MRRRISPVRHRRYWTRPGVVVIVLLAVCYYFLPYDRNATSFSNSLPGSGRYLPALYDDVGVILKTGYGTQHRVSAQIEALGLRPHTVDGNNMIVIGDWAGEVVYGDKGEQIFVHDVIAPVLDSGILGSRANCARAEKYRALAAAVHAGDDVEAMRISKSDGWELDAMKFIPGLELAYQTMPNKNWYLLLDDDTFVIPSSLRLLLAHLDHSVPHYIGNAVGDFRGRFAHGGSAIVLSREAVTLLLGSGSSRVLAVAAAAAASNRQQGITTNSYKSGLAPPLLHQAYVDSITETWGDKLLATTLMRVGVYLDERFARLFNGARPRATRISADRFCMPLVSFHALAKPEQMRSVGAVFRQIDRGQRGGTPSDATSPGFLAPPIAWGDLWALYGRPTVAALHHQPIHRGRDFVGAPGDDSSSSALVTSVTENVGSPEACRVLCAGDDGEGDDAMGADGFQRRFAGLYSYNSKCLAWTWNAGEQTCTTSPWFVVGEDESTGVAPPSAEPASSTTETTSTKYSGVNVALLRQLVGRCGQRDGVSWTERGDKYEFRYNPSGTL
ncbi:hypothetical protein SPBR_08305 [Sporothrix brasiliensis 5110]|uniref:N-acetylgalactosaminide beta-1,3-galactosyltransferase n=1 Tax=Sporothrix brasiliensis 5110 TaxID=1398154 RepID=A0A0C2F5H1_9PEZI|nr:uncharacterized protein SPBR_08305 [Sporothrix brasiliensis 5110]KIH86293.1 hypothetical protein SPBR_08305 [Sporothrix brasiliensis 5110]